MAPSRSFVCWNNKGGVGKTTICFHIGMEIADNYSDKKILFIDLDNQCSLSSLCFGGATAGVSHIEDQYKAENLVAGTYSRNVVGFFNSVLERQEPSIKDFCVKMDEISNPPPTSLSEEERIRARSKNPSNVYFMPGGFDLDLTAPGIEHEVAGQSMPGRIPPFYRCYGALKRALSLLDESWIVMIDCNPSYGVFTRIALLTAEELIIPTTLDEFSLGGVQSLFNQMGITNRQQFSQITFRQFVEERQQAASIGRPGQVQHPTLSIAKVRSIIVNRYPDNVKLAASGSVSFFNRGLFNLLMKAIKESPDAFAEPHGGARKEDILDVYIHEACELRSALSISMAYGVPVSTLCEQEYHLATLYPDTNDDDEGGGAVTTSLRMKEFTEGSEQEVQAISNAKRVASLKFCLAIGNITMMIMQSKFADAYVAKGSIAYYKDKNRRNFIEMPLVLRTPHTQTKDRRRGDRKVISFETDYDQPNGCQWIPDEDETKQNDSDTNGEIAGHNLRVTEERINTVPITTPVAPAPAKKKKRVADRDGSEKKRKKQDNAVSRVIHDLVEADGEDQSPSNDAARYSTTSSALNVATSPSARNEGTIKKKKLTVKGPKDK